MEVEIFSLCDAATHSAGKLNILGAFDMIASRKFPMVYPHCAIAIRMRFDRTEAGDHKVRINFIDADGKPVMPALEGNITVKFAATAQSVCANMVLGINGLKLEKPGHYAVDLSIDDRHEKSLPVNMTHVADRRPQPPQTDTKPPKN
jgi:hypothetical protein